MALVDMGYTTRDIADLLDLTPAQIRGFARAGFLSPRRGPRGEFRFSFQDVVLLRTAKVLVEARVPARRVRAALRKLLDQLPSGRPLSAVRVRSDGDRVVVRDAGVTWNPDTGQTVLDFEVAELAEGLAPAVERMVGQALAIDDGMDAEDWYVLGTELEAVSAGQAAAAYEHAIAIDPEHADAQVNRGRLHQEERRFAAAQSCYRAALRAEPEHATAAFNLGTVLEDEGRDDEALAAYRQAIEIDPACTDAHFNLARLYEKDGLRDAALRHLRSYRALTN